MDRTFLLWSCANRLHSLSAALSQFARLAEHTDTLSSGVQDVVASAGFSVAFLRSVQAQAPLLLATVAAMGTPFRSPIPLPKRAPPQRASEPARGSVPPGLCDPLLEAVSGSLPPRVQLSMQARPVGPWWRRDISQLPEPTFISISTVEARPTGLTNSAPLSPATVAADHARSDDSSWPQDLEDLSEEYVVHQANSANRRSCMASCEKATSTCGRKKWGRPLPPQRSLRPLFLTLVLGGIRATVFYYSGFFVAESVGTWFRCIPKRWRR